MMKKRLLSFIMVIAMCLGLCAQAVAAGDSGITYTAQPDKSTFAVSAADQTVTVTVDASEVLTWDGIGFKAYYDAPLKLVDITNKEVTLTAADKQISKGSGIDGAGFSTADSENSTIKNIAVLTFTIPANTPAGTYNLGIKKLEITKDYAGTFIEKNAEAMTSITVEEGSVGSGITYTAQPDKSTFNVSAADQTVTVTVDASEVLTWDGIGFKAYYDAPLRLVDITNKEVTLTAADKQISKGSGIDGAGFSTADSENSTIRNIAVLTFTIPANTPAGTYNLGIKKLEITRDYAGTFIEKNAEAMTSITVEEGSVGSGITYTAQPDKSTFAVSTADQTVTVTVDASEVLTWDGIGFKAYYDAPLKLVDITNKEVTLTAADKQISKGSGIDGAGFQTADSENSTIKNIAVLTFTIPANTPAGTYNLGIKKLEITRDYAGTFIEKNAEAMTSITVTAEVHTHNYVTGAYSWNADHTACTVEGTCACGNKITASAVVTSEITKAPTCTEMGQTTYTAAFAEAWAETQVKTVTNVEELGHDYHVVCSRCGEVDPNAELTEEDVEVAGDIAYEVEYAVDSRIVVVNHDMACKVGYLTADGTYEVVEAVAREDGSYGFDLPMDASELLIVVKGDSNGDGIVNAADKMDLSAALVRKNNEAYVPLETEAQKFALDINGDGLVNAADKMALAAALVRKTNAAYMPLSWTE